ncbi:MAG: ribosomal-protein-alanine N-acetyltransferase [Thermoplasmatales archaeon B_DKE]|nr:MAG: ribosomal-protein-alanine N-acetyltransferase [Thermoplasmatales archaeon B_DKE]
MAAVRDAAVAGTRKFAPDDISEVVKIGNNSLTEYYTETLLLDLFEAWPNSFMVYTVNGRIVGFIVGSKFSKTEARILLLAVDAKFRRMGIGRALMNGFVEVCNHENLLSARLEVRTDNDQAIGFYKKLGFSTISVIRSYYSDASDAYLMWKLL